MIHIFLKTFQNGAKMDLYSRLPNRGGCATDSAIAVLVSYSKLDACMGVDNLCYI